MDNKATRVLLGSGARVADTASVQQVDRNYRAVRLYLNVSVVPGAGGLQVVIRAIDQISGTAVEISDGGLPVQSTGLYLYEMQPTGRAPEPSGNVREVVNRGLPFAWDVLVKHGDASSYTYSLAAELQ